MKSDNTKDQKIGASVATDSEAACKTTSKTEQLAFFKPRSRSPARDRKKDASKLPPNYALLAVPALVPTGAVDLEVNLVCKQVLRAAHEGSSCSAVTRQPKYLSQELEVVETVGAPNLMHQQQHPLPSQPGAYSVDGVGSARTISSSSSQSSDASSSESGDDDEIDALDIETNGPLEATLVDCQQSGLDGSPSTPRRQRDISNKPQSRKPDLVDARPCHFYQGGHLAATKRKISWFGLGLCFFIVLVAAISLLAFPDSIGLSSPDESPEPVRDRDPEMLVMTSHPPPTPPFLENLNADTYRELQDPTSASSKANAWISADPNLQSYSRERALERFALATLFYATDGENWNHKDGWLHYTLHECEWWSSSISGMCGETSKGSVVNLELAHNNLHGTIPYELDYLYELRVLDLGYNKLYGTLSAVGAETPHLQVALVNDNQLQGMLSTKSAFVPEFVRRIDVSNNLFVGETLNTIAKLPGLEGLKASGNAFGGRLDAPTFGALVNLTTLHVSDCQLTGPLPSELGSLSKLQELDLSSNQFTGAIPKELSSLSRLELFNVSDTFLTGDIPESLCNKTNTVEIVADCSSTLQCCVNP